MKTTITKFNLYIKFIPMLPWLSIICFICCLLLNMTHTAYCNSSDWDQQWVQGADLTKQPDWLKNNTHDPRSLYEQMNGPAWRNIRDYYDVDNNNKYLGYGWNQQTTQINSPEPILDNFEYVVDNILENNETELNTAPLNNAKNFVSNIESFSHSDKVMSLREYIYNEILKTMQDRGCTSNNNYMNLKYIVYDTISNPILMELWSVPIGENNPAQNPIANGIVSMGYLDLNNPKTSAEDKQIYAHILTQINLTNLTRGQNISMNTFLDNDETYLLLLQKTISYRYF